MAVKRFQRVGVVQPESIVEQSSKPSSSARVEPRFASSGSMLGAIPPNPSSHASQGAVSGIAVESLNLGGGKATFPLSTERAEVITTVVRGSRGIAIHRWGGMIMTPLYWLDTEPELSISGTHRKWSATTATRGTKWSILQRAAQRFTLSVDGSLQWPAVRRYGN